VTKHTKAGSTARGSSTGGLVHTEAPVHVSNVQVVDPATKKPTRLGVRVEQVEKRGRTRAVRTRIARRSGKDIG
jgi:large subunit ribosomal protein L24